MSRMPGGLLFPSWRYKAQELYRHDGKSRPIEVAAPLLILKSDFDFEISRDFRELSRPPTYLKVQARPAKTGAGLDPEAGKSDTEIGTYVAGAGAGQAIRLITMN